MSPPGPSAAGCRCPTWTTARSADVALPPIHDIRNLLAPHLGERGTRPALIHHGQTYSYADLDKRVARLADALSSRLAPGELLALWLPNSPELLCLLLASLRCGLLPMPLHAGMKWPEVRNALQHAGVRLLIGGPAQIATSAEVPADLGLVAIYTTGDSLNENGHPSLDSLLAASTGDSHRPITLPDDPALVLLTSGSAGRPKGVVLSAGNLSHIIELRLTHTGLDTGSIAVVASCLTQSVGLHQSLALIAAGGCLVLLDGYDIEAMVNAIDDHQPTHLIMVVDAFERLLSHPALSAERLRALRFAAVGADRVTARLQERFIELTGKPLHVSYGMTESSWALVNFSGSLRKCLALGRPPAGAVVRLVDDEGREIVVAEQIGEIQIRSPRTMCGYLNDPALTHSVFVDGWLRSGDLAYRDADGDYWFAGRRKHLIVLSSGDNVSPIEIEHACLEHPGVAQCLVVAVHDAAADRQEAHAYVTRSDPAVDEATLRNFLGSRLSDFKIPRRIFIVDALPVGLTGKQQITAAAC